MGERWDPIICKIKIGHRTMGKNIKINSDERNNQPSFKALRNMHNVPKKHRILPAIYKIQ